MSIKNIIEQLEKERTQHGDNVQVYFAVDEEGNDFKRVDEVGFADVGDMMTSLQDGKEICGVVLWTNE